ncbi:MAG: hypothetical protein ABI835_02070 [Chloroflexota bacterium]
MARIKTRGVYIDTANLARDMDSIAEATRKRGTELIKESLQAMVDGIATNSIMRASALKAAGIVGSSGTTDNPMRGARVVSAEKRSGLGTRRRGGRVLVYVDHTGIRGINLFNLLDAGTKPREVTSRFVFPRYIGHVTPSTVISGDPQAVRLSISSANISLMHDAQGNPLMASPKVGKMLKAFLGRGFYAAAGKYAKEKLLSEKIVTASGKYSYKLSKDQIIIKATDRNRFKKL